MKNSNHRELNINFGLKRIMKIGLYLFVLLVIFNNGFAIDNHNQKFLKAIRISTSPKIDGLLKDSVWQIAEPTDDFLQQEPNAGNPPTFRTVVKALYDSDALYIGVFCYDPEPNKMIARELKSDGNLRGDDNFMIIFDTFNDKKSAYWFGTNPLGMRDDAILSGTDFRGFNEEWNGIWEVKTAITDIGWSIEFKFPFSTFKFSNSQQQVWGINFSRQIRRLNEQVLWAGVGPNLGMFKLSHAGLLIGIENVKRGNPIYFKPFLSGGFQKSEERNKVLKPGLDIKYGITQNLSLDLTFNTDFAQIEADRMRINLTRFPLFFPEKRDFFLENINVFDYTLGFRNYIFYSRRIGLSKGREIPINAGARLVGRINNYEVGLLNVQTAVKGDEPTTNYGVIRFKRDLFDQSYIGFILTNKISKRGYNRVFGFDAQYTNTSFLGDKTLSVGTGALRSDETNGGRKNYAFKIFASYPNDELSFFASYRIAQKDFNPEMGFLFMRGFQSVTSNLRFTPRVNFYGMKKIVFQLYEIDYYWNEKKEFSLANLSFSPFGFITNSDDRFHLFFVKNFEFVENEFTLFDTNKVTTDKYWFNSYGLNLETSRRRNLFGEFSFITGGFYNGNKQSYEISLNATPSKHLTISLDYDINRIEFSSNRFTTHEIGGRIRYDFTTMVYSSVFAQWNNELNELNINYRFSWQPKLGSYFYLVINHLVSTEGDLKKSRTKDIVILSKVVWFMMI